MTWRRAAARSLSRRQRSARTRGEVTRNGTSLQRAHAGERKVERQKEAAISGEGENRFTDFEAGLTRVSSPGARWDLGLQRVRGRGCWRPARRRLRRPSL
jgi:hypothetical protein